MKAIDKMVRVDNSDLLRRDKMKTCLGWLRLKREMNEFDLARKIMEDYIEKGNYSSLEPIYDTTKETIHAYFRKRESRISRLYPELYKKYKKAKSQSRKRNRAITKRKPTNSARKNHLKHFTLEQLDILPKTISYTKFLDFITQYNTGKLTTDKLIAEAKSRGIEVTF
jgi:hypothetical protein